MDFQPFIEKLTNDWNHTFELGMELSKLKYPEAPEELVKDLQGKSFSYVRAYMDYEPTYKYGGRTLLVKATITVAPFIYYEDEAYHIKDVSS